MNNTALCDIKNPPSFFKEDEPRHSFIMGEDFVEKHNIAWRVEPAKEEAANPILEAKYPWESAGVFSHGTILRDPIDGLWKAWYIAVPEHELSPSCERRLCYAVSNDGINWERPELDICSYQDFKRTNILISIESGGSCQHASVMIHPEAPEDSRYEMFLMRLPGWECEYKIVEGFPLPPGQSSHQDAVFSVGLYRYLSEDGLHWRPWHQVKIDTSDSGWVSQLGDGSYVMYHKIVIPAFPGGLIPYDVAAGVCRVMVRRTSKDGEVWSPPELILTPDWQDGQDVQFMELSPLPAQGGHVGIVTVYHLLSQTIDLQFAGSRDGKKWWRPSRRACVPLRPLGDPGGGMIFPMHPLIEHEGRVYVYYAGCEGLHNDYMSTLPMENMRQAGFKNWPHYHEPLTLGEDSYSPLRGCLWFQSSLCRASWEKARFWAAVTATGGNLTGDLLTRELVSTGAELTVNLVTVKDGALEAEILSDGKVVPGFSRADCEPVQGNHYRAALQWKGGAQCPKGKIQIRFFLRRARFYGFDFEENAKVAA